MGMDPISWIAIGSTVLGAVNSAQGAQAEGEAKSDAAAYRAQILRQNEAISQEAAKTELERGAATAQQRGVQTAQMIGNQRATLASHGVDVGAGSAVDLVADTARSGAMDQNTIIQDANRRALQLKMQGQNYEMQAQLALREGADAKEAGNSGMLGSLLGGAGKVASIWGAAA